MRDNALYFPYISVPNSTWTLKALLYWDRLSSIVPMDYIERPGELSPFMRSLVQEDLVQQVFPAAHLHEIPGFEKCFIALIGSRLYGSNEARLRRHDIYNRKRLRFHIHAEKLEEIPRFLIENGLAERINNSWYDVEGWAARLFMSYLASCLGALDVVNAAPVTDQSNFSGIFGGPSSRRNNHTSRHHGKARDVILKSLLPIPNEKVTLDKILRFKSDYGHLLPAFRHSVESHCSIVATLPNAEDKILANTHFIEQNKLQVDEIIDAMKPTWRSISFGSIVPLFGAGLTWYSTGADNKLAYAGAASTFAACAYQAISTIHGNREINFKKPLAYIAHAHKSFGV
ncbi:DUF6236 family protein [Cobetia marina]|uniref:DUF6236 family protein n=1 Tax=Cobetia marina TaxID=28258 RepID=UPI0026E3156A|nr:DUF6236 family protein [Cobetia marina]MDO6786333.1 DUF6236 family protein [Cobetia marina]